MKELLMSPLPIDATHAERHHFIATTRVVAIDLDGVCCDYVHAIRQTLRDDLAVPTDAELALWLSDRTHRIEHQAAHDRGVAAGMYRTMREIPGAIAGIKALQAAGLRIHIVTARGTSWDDPVLAREQTLFWLRANDITVESLNLLSPKSIFEADVFVDDNPGEIAALRAAGRRAIVFEQAYNRHVAGPRARNWHDVVSMLTHDS
jgi:5'(3')-deoxyribonucleotidase